MSASVEKNLPKLGEYAKDCLRVFAQLTDRKRTMLGYVGGEDGTADRVVRETYQVAISAEKPVTRRDEGGGESERSIGLALLVVGDVQVEGPHLRTDASPLGEACGRQRSLARIGIDVLRARTLLLGPFLLRNAEVR